MDDLLLILKSLINLPGLSGYETTVRAEIEAVWKPLCDKMNLSKLGSLHALKSGNAPEPRPALLLAAHMDAIGLIVTGITDGFLRVTKIGGLDPRVLPGQPVVVHGRKLLPGVIVQPPVHLLPEKLQTGPVPVEYLLIDTGLEPTQVSRLVQTGDLVSFDQQPIELSKELLVGHSLDNRASVAALTVCLQILYGRQLKWDLWAVATSQEEVTLGGAYTSGFQLRPSMAIAIDMTWGSEPGSPAHKTFPIGKGIVLGVGPVAHPHLHNSLKELAERLEIPYQIEAIPRYSATDADGLQVTAEGIPTMWIGIPLRYMHSPVEMVSLTDIERAGRLLAEFATGLQVDYLEKIKWE
jgi:putative aminopeptidase FrvX